MDKLMILLKSDTISVYDINGTTATIHTIMGEEETDVDDYTDVSDSIRDMYNDDCLQNVEIDVIYTNNNTEILKNFTEELLPCGGWQAFSFRKILPEILLKSGKLQPESSIDVSFDTESYNLSMDKTGEIVMQKSDGGEKLIDKDIAMIYKNRFNVFVNSVNDKKAEKVAYSNSDKTITNEIIKYFTKGEDSWIN